MIIAIPKYKYDSDQDSVFPIQMAIDNINIPASKEKISLIIIIALFIFDWYLRFNFFDVVLSKGGITGHSFTP